MKNNFENFSRIFIGLSVNFFRKFEKYDTIIFEIFARNVADSTLQNSRIFISKFKRIFSKKYFSAPFLKLEKSAIENFCNLSRKTSKNVIKKGGKNAYIEDYKNRL
jgi:hypothetical protein